MLALVTLFCKAYGVSALAWSLRDVKAEVKTQRSGGSRDQNQEILDYEVGTWAQDLRLRLEQEDK